MIKMQSVLHRETYFAFVKDSDGFSFDGYSKKGIIDKLRMFKLRRNNTNYRVEGYIEKGLFLTTQEKDDLINKMNTLHGGIATPKGQVEPLFSEYPDVDSCMI